jgi:biotin carboxylase
MGLGIPIIPGSEDILASPEAALDVAADVGYPVILKASGGAEVCASPMTKKNF